MKLELKRNINEFKEHAVRLSDFDSSEAALFRNAIDVLTLDPENTIDLAAFDFVQSVNCYLVLRTSREDRGRITADGVHFICDLTIGSYKNMASLLEPFCRKESKGYQWLYDLDNPIGFLFSAGKDMPDEE